MITKGSKIILRNTEGPNSFGYILKADVVSWTGQGHEDLLISRCWEGVFLLGSERIVIEDYAAVESKVYGSPVEPTLAFIADWNRDGCDDLIITDRWGFLYYFERVGEHPDLKFKYRDIMRSPESGLVFNLPYDNPNHFTGNLGGYIEPYFYNYTYPCLYPWGDAGVMHMIVGDWAGNLWWMEDVSGGSGMPVYRGAAYDKDVEKLTTKQGTDTIAKYGKTFLKPAEKICGEDGQPLLLGEGCDAPVYYTGANARPCVYFNEVTGSRDLVVAVGTVNFKILYLRQINPPGSPKPAFRVEGELPVNGYDIHPLLGHHTYPAVWRHEGRNDLLIPSYSYIGVLRNKNAGTPVPEFEWSGFLRGKDTVSCATQYTALLTDDKGGRYVLDSGRYDWKAFKLHGRGDETRIDPNGIDLVDQNGIFHTKGITDPNLGEKWGVHCAVRWDFDGSGRQHLIVGTDTGHLFLLIDEGGAGKNGKFVYRSVGPLKDESGNVIKIHNRVTPAAADMDGDGREDLLVSGVSYQCGIKSDPEIGGNVYLLRHKGIGADGLPVLTAKQPLSISGYDYATGINRHIVVQAYDLFGNGQKQIKISSGFDEPGYAWRIFSIDTAKYGITYTGQCITELGYDYRILDIDGDGKPEAVMAGDEPGVGNYVKLEIS